MAKSEENKKRRRAVPLLLAAAGLGAVALVGAGVTSLALFSDQEAVTGNSFTVGSINLTLDQSSALVTFTSPAMAPGDEVTSSLNVLNAGTLDLRYAMTSVTTEDVLAAELVMTIRTGVTTCDNTNWDADGSVIYSGVLGTIAGTAVIGSNAAGADTGDRALAPAADEDLCFNVTLPTNASNAVQGVTSTATFTFDAEQTANNP